MKILVVDDSAAYRRMLEVAVAALGHDCVVAEDGAQAWEAFEAEGADVVISNWMMPGIDGTELCRRIRRSKHPYAFFILFTALEGKKNILTGMEAGADDYLAKPLNEDELEACLVAATRVTALHRRLGDQQQELERLNRELYEQSRQDPLMAIGNRLRMREDLEATEANMERYGHCYAIALCDIDRFKTYNDRFGHPAGDAALRSVADALRKSCRRGDAVYRYGGEELAVVLPGQEVEVAAAAAERMRKAIEDLAIPHPYSQPAGVVTVSIGVAVRRSGDPSGPEAVLQAADAALYEAKEKGRNRVVIQAS
jgi:diguanylate cyclase (GGDEF)-like protein